MFYEGLYLVQKTGVNAARTLYNLGLWVNAFYSKTLTITIQTDTPNSYSYPQNTYRGRDEIGGVYLPSKLHRTLQHCTWWKIEWKGVGVHPHPHPARLNVRQKSATATLCVLCARTFRILWLDVAYVLCDPLHGHQLLFRLSEGGDQARQTTRDSQSITATRDTGIRIDEQRYTTGCRPPPPFLYAREGR